MSFKLISPGEFKSLAWKNGKGMTRELICGYRPGDDLFAWRLSMAPVLSDGVFSDFSGYQRHLILIEGGGISLNYAEGGGDHLSQRFDCAHFDGGCKTTAILHNGAITDFNIMTRRDVCTAEVFILQGSKDVLVQSAAAWLLHYALDSDTRVTRPDSDPINLNLGHLLQVPDPGKGTWRVTGAASICVLIRWV